MRYRFISDSHTHSKCSFDGNDSVNMMCENAFAAGLYSITITDHCECNEYFQNNVRKDIQLSVHDIANARAMYLDKIKVFTGIELGQPTQDVKAAEDALSLADYDFVLGSLHNLRGEQDFYFLQYTEESAEKLLNRYWEEMLELAEQNLFDSLAHMDYPLRYIIGNSGITFPPDKYREQIDAVLQVIIRNDKAIELNTSGLRQAIGRTLPDESILRRYRELGGKYVTIGSDAHRWGDIGSGVEDAMELLLKCGFSHFAIYEKREPDMMPIR